MSTKIHNGLILKGCTLEEALQRLKKIRPACVERAKLATARQVAKKVVYRMDFSENWQALDRKDRKAVWQITEDFRKAQIAVTGEGIRSTTWDSSLDVCLIPSEGDLLALVYLEQDHGYWDLLKGIGFTDFHYQNSTDKPDAITEEEWSQRSEKWDIAIPRGTVPCNVGVTYHLVTWDDFGEALFNRPLIEAQVPSEESRRKAVAVGLTEIEVGRNHKGMRLMEMMRLINESEVDRRRDVLLCPEPFA